jgi:hypothetical protein
MKHESDDLDAKVATWAVVIIVVLIWVASAISHFFVGSWIVIPIKITCGIFIVIAIMVLGGVMVRED